MRYLFLLLTLSAFTLPSAAFAYVDPGTGHLILQGNIALCTTAIVTVSVFLILLRDA
jgi:hypothetical protein